MFPACSTCSLFNARPKTKHLGKNGPLVNLRANLGVAETNTINFLVLQEVRILNGREGGHRRDLRRLPINKHVADPCLVDERLTNPQGDGKDKAADVLLRNSF